MTASLTSRERRKRVERRVQEIFDSFPCEDSRRNAFRRSILYPGLAHDVPKAMTALSCQPDKEKARLNLYVTDFARHRENPYVEITIIPNMEDVPHASIAFPIGSVGVTAKFMKKFHKLRQETFSPSDWLLTTRIKHVCVGTPFFMKLFIEPDSNTEINYRIAINVSIKFFLRRLGQG